LKEKQAECILDTVWYAVWYSDCSLVFYDAVCSSSYLAWLSAIHDNWRPQSGLNLVVMHLTWN